MNQPQTIHTDRLTLRPLAATDAADLFTVYSHPEAMRYWDTPPHKTIAATEELIERKLAHQQGCAWSICLAQNGRAIGVVEYLGNPGPSGLGYILHPSHWRQGYTTEAVHAALDYGFTVLELDRVELWINDENVASQRLAEKVGFTRRGRFQQKYHHHSSAHEKFVYGLYRHVWQQRAGEPPASPSPPRFYSVQPILLVPDVAATVAYYCEKLDFAVSFLYGDPPTHGAVSRGDWTTEGATIQFSQRDALDATRPTVELYFFVGSQIDLLYAGYVANGVEVVREPATMPWGMREFTMRDCNGYRLRFGTPG
jgi:[ribosomal protein S5]-alanine N-acetyltransferase